MKNTRTRNIKYFSMFSGIGGFELGIQQAINNRSTCVGYSEIDKHAIKVYERQFSGHTNYGDATAIEPNRLPDFDLLVGGFPCQSFSIAGKRGGFDDTRGTLFFDIARIVKAKRPGVFVLENVKGLLSHDRGRTFDTIIRTIDELGYDCQWQVLNSKDFGVPQNRERIYIVGHLRGQPRPQVFSIGHDGRALNELAGHLANTLTARYAAAQGTGTYIAEGELDAQEISQLNQPKHSNDRDFSPRRGKRLEPRADGAIGAITSSRNLDNILTDQTRIRRLTPIECERLQGFPDNWTALDPQGGVVSDTQRYKMCGNAVTVNVVGAVMERIL